MLSQLNADLGRFAAAQAWLDKVPKQDRELELQTRRAIILAKQGRLEQARALIRALPAGTPEQAREKTLAEVQVLRTVDRWKEASSVLTQALSKSPDDVDMLYELAMAQEKMGRMDELERLLRRIIALKPDHHHAHNALGYSMADRGVHLEEARVLVLRALELQPGDPFITDSLGWVEFRLGHVEEALTLLRRAYQARPDIEIGTHLGEVLWIKGERDEARRIWRIAREKDRRNKLLQDTLTRLKVDL